MLEDNETGYRAKIILLKDEGYIVPEIRKITNHHHDHNIRKWKMDTPSIQLKRN
jgi:hypothetical protein